LLNKSPDYRIRGQELLEIKIEHDTLLSTLLENNAQPLPGKTIEREKEIAIKNIEKFDPIDIKINDGQEIVVGVKDDDGEVYYPFSFLSSYYEAYSGSVKGAYSGTVTGAYHFWHNNAVWKGIEDYTPAGAYLNSNMICVENWNNYFDGISIPVNTFSCGQHYYPISIGHYGLSHYSRLLIAESEIDTQYDVGPNQWGKYSGIDTLQLLGQDGVRSSGMCNAYTLPVNSDNKYINITLSLRSHNYRVYFEVETDEGIKYIQLFSGLESLKGPNSNYHSIGIPFNDVAINERVELFRDLDTDVKKFFDAEFIRLVSVKIRGDLDVYKVSSSKTNHRRIAKRVADWFVEKQDYKGGWPANFDHLFYSGRTEIMKEGWYSSMAQGLAISHLVRAYDLFEDPVYLESAKKALIVYSVPVADGGILDYYNSSPIYEEYPTTPSSHVLNGFIFSLFGLYDLMEYTGDLEAKRLYEDGISSLEKILPLYDMGNRSAYDLTHITSSSFPNIARWQYHATHVHQLEALVSINDSKIIKEFHDRWSDYAFGFKVTPN
jgi:heparosan-N-sulfate-glucuronate 5-epimerase